ncbi:MAG: mechanosensitive ion channel family protein [Candidatus Bilamarchaeaceae archaeon]
MVNFFVLEGVIPDFILSLLKGLPGGDLVFFLSLLILVYLIVFIILKIVLTILKFLSSKTKTTLDDDLLRVGEKYSHFFAILFSVFLSLQTVYPNLILGKYDETQVFIILFLGLLSFFIAEILDTILVWYGMSIQPPERKKISPKQIFPFVRTLIKAAVHLIFLIFILQFAGFDTAALLTGLGVAGLAVALALQDTLGNFFAGIHILMDKPFREGDYIQMDNGMEGTIDRIGWRTTKIITPDNNELVVPNSKLSNAIIKNFATPDKKVLVFYEVGVSYDSDPDEVEDAILKVIQRVAEKNTNLDPSNAFVRLQQFGDFALIFRFGYHVNGYSNRFPVLREINKELLKEFRKRKIEIPFPIRTVITKKD